MVAITVVALARGPDLLGHRAAAATAQATATTAATFLTDTPIAGSAAASSATI
jgi:hypothetical protein